MLLDSLYENDPSNNKTYEVQPIITLDSSEAFTVNSPNDIPLDSVQDLSHDPAISNICSLDANNNSLGIEDPEKLFESFEEEISVEDADDPDYSVDNDAGDSSDEETDVDTTEEVTAHKEGPLQDITQERENTGCDVLQNESLIDKDTGQNASIQKADTE
jgi:hypothetical protein